MKYYSLGISCALLIGYLSMSADPTKGIDINFSDKIGHFVAYAILVTTLLWGAYKNQELTRTNIGKIVLFSVFYGALLEGIQYYLPHRYFEVLDLIANTLGSFLGITSIILFRQFKP